MLKPDIAKKVMFFLQKGRRIYLDGAVNLSLAAVFFIGANQCRYPWIIFVCGIIFMAEALMIFGLGSEKTNFILDWGREQSNELYRFIGLLIGVMGVIVVFST
jgi:hypothetical protein